MRTLAFVLLCCGLAAAQDSAMREKLQKQMEEISRLMRDSEGKLLEMTRVDTVVEAQARIVEELQKLLDKPPPAANAAAEQREKRRQELEAQQEEITRKLKEMFEGQERSASQCVKELQELLRSLPRQRHGQGQPDEKQKRQRQDRQKRLRNDREEKTQKEPRSPRDKRERKRDPRTGKRVKDETEAAARLRRIEAWIARLPPEDQERINRNDFSTIPPRYQRLVREYTALRAQREAKEEKDR
ncbi:MAG: hypothetical protein ACYTDU_01635 [Planctomycetota bacterium]|jgi:hypothetical protein